MRNSDFTWSRYDSIVEEYDRVSVPHFFKPVAEQLVSLLPLGPGQLLLDVACGTGIVAATAESRSERLRCVGVDLSLPMMLRARLRGVRRLVAANIFELPFRDRSFDHLTASFVMNHLDDAPAALVKVTNVLRKGGTIGLTSWAVGPSENIVARAWKEVAETWVSSDELQSAARHALPSEEKLSGAEALPTILRDAAFRVLRSEQARFVSRFTTADYTASRHSSLSARFMRRVLSAERWEDFERTVTSALIQRFGSSVEIETTVNFAVATRET